MEKNELRIGNILKSGKSYYRVYALSYPMILAIQNVRYDVESEQGIFSSDSTILEPITLTEEILLKCGFEYEDLADESPFEIYKKDAIEMWEFNGEYWLCDMLDQNGIDHEFKYLHQLQNLYFALTGQELQFKP